MVKISSFYNLVAKNPCLAFSLSFSLLRTFRISPNFHNIMTLEWLKDGWFLFWYQWSEETNSYTLVVNTRVYGIL